MVEWSLFSSEIEYSCRDRLGTHWPGQKNYFFIVNITIKEATALFDMRPMLCLVPVYCNKTVIGTATTINVQSNN